MTLKAKASIISLLTLALIALSMKLFGDYDALNNSIVANLVATEKILVAKDQLFKNFTTRAPDFKAAMQVIESVPGTVAPLDITRLTADELHYLVTVKMSFIRIGRLLQSMPADGVPPPAKLRQIGNELDKIEASAAEFRESFRRRMEQEKLSKKNLVIVLYLSGVVGILVALLGFYRYFIGPILSLSADIKDLRDGKRTDRRPPPDEIGRLAEFTNQTLRPLSSGRPCPSAWRCKCDSRDPEGFAGGRGQRQVSCEGPRNDPVLRWPASWKRRRLPV
jgi:hypothetical protein